MRGIVRQMLAGKARGLVAEAERIGTRLTELTAAGSASCLRRFSGEEGEQDSLNQRIYVRWMRSCDRIRTT